MRAKTVEGRTDESIPERVGLTRATIEEMYKIMALAAYGDRYVIPTAHRELDEDAYVLRGSSGFGFREDSNGKSKAHLFGGAKRSPRNPLMEGPTCEAPRGNTTCGRWPDCMDHRTAKCRPLRTSV